MLNWQKTNLLPIAIPVGETTIHTEARLAFRTDEEGKIALAVHSLRKEPQLDFPDITWVRSKPLPKNKVHPTSGVWPELPDPLSQKCTDLPPQPPTRTRSARVRCFSFFAFTSSPYDCKWLENSDLRVKASPFFPSPVKAGKGYFLHAQHTLYQRIAGEDEGWRQEFRTRWVRDAQGRVRSRVGLCGWGNSGWYRERMNRRLFPKSGEEAEKRRGVSKESPQVFVCSLPILKKTKHFSREIFDSSKLNPYFCAW